MLTVEGFELAPMPRLVFGSGTISDLPEYASQLGTRPLLVTGRGSLRRSGRLDEIVNSLEARELQVAIFEGVEPEPTLNLVERGRQMLRENDCDLVIAIGGGSAMDVGKAIAGLANEPGPAAEYHSGRPLAAEALPIIAAPTTSGTGSEVTPVSVLTDPQRPIKASIHDDKLLPRVAIVDPELTLTLPPRPTADAGLDAFTQALEAYTSIAANFVTDAGALEALRRVGSSLRRAYHRGDDRAARENMSLGSLLAGMALASARLGLVHGLAHPIGLLYHLPHGQACAMLLPHVIRYNMQAAQAKYATAARALGISDEADDAAAQRLYEWVSALCEELEVSGSLGEFGATEADFEAIIAAAMKSGSTAHNPRPVTEADLREFLQDIL